MTAPPVFRLRDLTHRYDGTRRRPGAVALDGVSVDLRPGVTGVLGLSGSGKTTLLNILGLLDNARLTGGQVTYQPTSGKPIDYADLRPRGRAELRQAEFGFVLQSALLLPHLTCRENVAVPLALTGAGRAARLARADELLEAADRADPAPAGGPPRRRLVDLRHARPREVSGGERQRVAVVRAIAHDPRVVFADEPFSNLDPRNTAEILDLFRAWLGGGLGYGNPDRGRTLLLVSHTVATTIRFAAGRCLVVRDGRVARDPDGPPLAPTDDALGPTP